MKRGELANAMNCNIETIRYYENIGLLKPPRRSSAGHRLYCGEDQARLGFILRTRGLGFSIKEIRSLLALVDGGDFTCGEVHALTVKHLENVQKKISDLQRLGKILSDMAARCEGGAVPECPVIDALFAGYQGKEPVM